MSSSGAGSSVPTANHVKESLVKYDPAVAISEKTPGSEKADKRKSTARKAGSASNKLPPVLDASDKSKLPSQIEDILNSIMPPRYQLNLY
jgi:hypothetical protein